MYYINKIVGFLVSPIGVAFFGGFLALLCAKREHRRVAKWIGWLTVAWLWLWSTPVMYRWVGLGLEREWPVVLAEDAPKADAIVILGGGMAANTNVYKYAEMWGGADRVWHAARLWKSGKAPIVIASGTGEREATVPLLRDFGVAEAAIVVEDKARNTEENAKFVEDILTQRSREAEEEGDGVKVLGKERAVKDKVKVKGDVGRMRVLLVTSAWHMRRSVLMFKKYAPNLEIIPAATDYEGSIRMCREFSFGELLPSADYLSLNSSCFKEHIGYWGYRLLRK